MCLLCVKNCNIIIYMKKFNYYISNKGPCCRICYNKKNNITQNEYIEIDEPTFGINYNMSKNDKMMTIEWFEQLNKLNCNTCKQNLEQLYLHDKQFHIFSSKYDDLDYCNKCFHNLKTNKKFSEIISPNMRAINNSYSSWKNLLSDLNCDGCNSNFVDIFCGVSPNQPIRSTQTHYLPSMSSGLYPSKPLTRMKDRSSGMMTTNMADRSSGIQKNKLSKPDMTLMMDFSSGYGKY